MALPAPEPITQRLRALADALRPQPGRMTYATRLALICALSVLVSQIYQTPEPALTAYVAFFINREDRTTSILLSFVMLMLITVVIGFVMLAAMTVADDSMWRVASMTVISLALLFVASASKLRAAGGTIALIVAYGLDLLGSIKIGEEATRGLLYAWLFVGIPVGVSIVVNLLIAPAPRRLAERALAVRLRAGAALLECADPPSRQAFDAVLRQGGDGPAQWLKMAGLERSIATHDLAALRQAVRSTVALMAAIDVLDRALDTPLSASLRQPLVRTLQAMASIFEHGGYPVDIDWRAPDSDALLPPAAMAAFAGIESALLEFAVPPEAVTLPPAPRSGFFLADAFSNPLHVRYALKTTAAAMFCYLTYSLLDWPGIHTCLITCYIVSLGTVAETLEKLTLRITGCLLGAAVGLLAMTQLIPLLDSSGGLLAVVFVGTLAAAYVAVGSPRIAYAGFQVAFAFLLCVVQGSGPAFDMVIARDRVIGILFGNFVVYLLFTHLWTVSVVQRIDPAIAGLLRRFAGIVRARETQTRRALASGAYTARGAIAADLELSRYEPIGLRPEAEWLESRQHVVREIDDLGGVLLLGAESPATADRLDALAARFDGTPAAATAEHREHAADSLQALVDARLRVLERGVDRLPQSTETFAHATA